MHRAKKLRTINLKKKKKEPKTENQTYVNDKNLKII